MGIHEVTNGRPAVFLDRDGVINELVWNLATEAYESPHRPEDFVLAPDVVAALCGLQKRGYALFVVSNQPSFAKGKTSREDIERIAERAERELDAAGIRLTAAYYCLHHPEGVVPGLTTRCRCRKPGTASLERARDEHQIALHRSWMIGDRDSDIECGKAAGCKTIVIENPHSQSNRGMAVADFTCVNLAHAVERLLQVDEPGEVDESE